MQSLRTQYSVPSTWDGLSFKTRDVPARSDSRPAALLGALCLHPRRLLDCAAVPSSSESAAMSELSRRELLAYSATFGSAFLAAQGLARGR